MTSNLDRARSARRRWLDITEALIIKKIGDAECWGISIVPSRTKAGGEGDSVMVPWPGPWRSGDRGPAARARLYTASALVYIYPARALYALHSRILVTPTTYV